MNIYPAIDIKNGKCVRLKQGKFDEVTIYNENPVEAAKEWEQKGASYLHVVDLDGALEGSSVNIETIAKICSVVSIPVQTGGGIRKMKHIEEKIAAGVNRVIIGTAAVKNPSLVKEAVEKFGADAIVVGIDAKDGMVAIEGWEKVSGKSAVELTLEMKEFGVKTIVYTDISKDGMLSGPNIESTKDLVEQTGLDIIASGGVSSMKDLEELSTIRVEGAIIGKALYHGAIKLEDVVNQFERG